MVLIKHYEVGNEVRPGEVAQKVNDRRENELVLNLPALHLMTPQKAGRILKNVLELPSLGHDSEGARYKLDHEQMSRLRERFGYGFPETPQTSETSTKEHDGPEGGQHPDTNDGSAGDVSDDSDVSLEDGPALATHTHKSANPSPSISSLKNRTCASERNSGGTANE